MILGLGQTRANKAPVTLGGGASVVENDASGTLHLIVDVNGCFERDRGIGRSLNAMSYVGFCTRRFDVLRNRLSLSGDTR